MPTNAQKTPLVVSLSQMAEMRVRDVLAQKGRALPCSVVKVRPPKTGSGIVPIVTVQFEIQGGPPLPQIECPVANSAYVREPLQVGDKGQVYSSDAHVAGVSGMADMIATAQQPPGNLAALTFYPIGNAQWDGTPADKLALMGPHGVVIEDAGHGAIINLGTNAVTIIAAGTTLTIDGSGVHVNGGRLTVDGGPIVNNGTTVALP